MARVYVAAWFGSKEEVKDVYTLLKEAGHTISHDWTNTPLPLASDGTPVCGQALRKHITREAKLDVDGVRTADVVLVFPHQNGKGLFTELGVAIALNKPIIIINDDSVPFEQIMERKDGSQCIFLYMRQCIHVKALGEAIRLINWEVNSAPFTGPGPKFREGDF